MKLLNLDEKVPEMFYIFIGQGKTLSSQVNYHNYELGKKLISSGFSSLFAQSEFMNQFIEGDIVYAPFVPNNTTLHSPSSHQLNVVNGYQTEYILEYTRDKYYKKYPSRLSCLYAFGDYESCEKANKLYKWDLSKVKKFKLKTFNNDLDKCIKIVKCNMEIVTLMWNSEIITFEKDSIDRISRAYWDGINLVATEQMNIADRLYTQKVSDTLYEYLIEGILEEVE